MFACEIVTTFPSGEFQQLKFLKILFECSSNNSPTKIRTMDTEVLYILVQYLYVTLQLILITIKN